MDYKELTKEFMDDMFLKKPPFKHVLDLSRGEMGTMLYLVVENDKAIVGDISNRLELSSGRMASIIKGLEKKGYITKSKSEVDKRKMIVSPTEKGRKLIKEHGETVFNRIYHLLRFLGEEDAKHYVRINKRLNKEFNPNQDY